jgi:hypothetical protein
MSLPYTFANLTTAQLNYLDANFAALGALTPIPCSTAGTNALALTPLANSPTVTQYANYGAFSGVVAVTNTTAVTAQVGSLPALAVYKDTSAGPAVLTGGELVAGNAFYLVYDAALNSNTGGFHFNSLFGVVTVSGPPSNGQIATWTSATNLAGIATTGTGNVVRSSGATITNAAISASTVAATTLQTTTAYVYSTLPTPTTGLRGARAYITDASAATPLVGAAITGGGANVMPVFCNGTAWVYG